MKLASAFLAGVLCYAVAVPAQAPLEERCEFAQDLAADRQRTAHTTRLYESMVRRAREGRMLDAYRSNIGATAQELADMIGEQQAWFNGVPDLRFTPKEEWRRLHAEYHEKVAPVETAIKERPISLGFDIIHYGMSPVHKA
jgi:hypothetical protein